MCLAAVPWLVGDGRHHAVCTDIRLHRRPLGMRSRRRMMRGSLTRARMITAVVVHVFGTVRVTSISMPSVRVTCWRCVCDGRVRAGHAILWRVRHAHMVVAQVVVSGTRPIHFWRGRTCWCIRMMTFGNGRAVTQHGILAAQGRPLSCVPVFMPVA